MEPEVSCDLCGSSASSTIAREERFSVVRCHRCGHAFTSPRLPEDERAEYYGSGEFRDQYESPRDRGREDVAEWHVWAEHHRFVRLRVAFRAVPPPASVLEVGCGHGDLLATLAIHGYQVWGIEIDRTAAAVAGQRIGQDRVSTEPIERCEGREKFDLVLAFMVVEHVPSPTAFARELGRLVKPGGKLVVHVPNLEFMLMRARMHRSAPWLLPVHLHHFSLSSLTRVLGVGGFEVVDQFWNEYPFIPERRGASARWRATAMSRAKHLLWLASGRRVNLSTSIGVVAVKR